jgi:hypothetical protein
MDITFTPSPDVSVVLNSLLDILERRNGTYHPEAEWSGRNAQHRNIKITLANLPLPTYFSQTDPTPRLTANEQLTILEKSGLITLAWEPGETSHILQSIKLTEHAPLNTKIFNILSRTPIANHRARLESLLLADKFRFQDDWRARAISHILYQIKSGKSPAPFNLTDSNLTLDLLTVLQALPTLTTETPYRVFSVWVFNDSKRFESIKSQLVSLARLGNPQWKRIPAEEVLRELNLVANPGYIHLAGNWRITTEAGDILDLGGFTPSVGFPAAQISSLRSVRAESVLCIENLTTFHQYTQQVDKYTGTHVNNGIQNTKHAVLCTYGNPSPAVRRILRLLPETTPVYLWSDMDYGGFNILSQLRCTVNETIRPYLMDIDTLEANVRRARPFTASDRANLKRLLFRPELRDVRLVVEHLLKCGLKMEQEAIQHEIRNK